MWGVEKDAKKTLVSGAAPAKIMAPQPFSNSANYPVRRKPLSNRDRQASPESTVDSVTCDSDSVRNRLARIETHYSMLDDMLADLEARLPAPAADENVSANPRKPR